MRGEVKFRRKLTRAQFRAFMAAQAPAVAVFETCGSASCRARGMAELGHEVRLVAPQHVRPVVKRRKNHAADAEAIVLAARRPETGSLPR
jgi:transposase